MLVVAICAVFAAGSLVLSGCGSSEEPEQEATEAEETVITFAEADVPDAVMQKVDQVKGVAGNAAEELTPAFGDQYVALIESGEAREYEGFAAMKEQLDNIRIDSGATYVYALSPAKDGQPSLDGEAAATRSAWADDEDGKVLCWSAFASELTTLLTRFWIIRNGTETAIPGMELKNRKEPVLVS